MKKFIYFSSAHVYQLKHEGVLNEKSPINPQHPYGVSKKIAEQTLFNKKELIEINIIKLCFLNRDVFKKTSRLGSYTLYALRTTLHILKYKHKIRTQNTNTKYRQTQK